MPLVTNSKFRARGLQWTGVAAALALLSGGVFAQTAGSEATIRGVVFRDLNGNGGRDASETGIAGVVVSNQRDVVVTDADGAFTMKAGTTGIGFVSVPTGYRASGRFWQKIVAAQSLSFGLIPTVQPTTFSFIHASDPHIEQANVARYRRFRTMADSIHPAFVLMLGDLIRDAMSQQEPAARSYFDLFTTETKQFKTPVFTIPGNHDHFGIIRTRSHVPETHPSYNRNMYREYFGPDYYSFDFGGVHFIGLNTISVDDSAYYGNVDSVEVAWLRQDVSHVKVTTPIVTFNHIPLVSAFDIFLGYSDDALVSSVANVHGVKSFRHTVSNTQEVMDAMKGHKYVLALGAHMHNPEKVEFLSDGTRVHFAVSAAIVGGQEVGEMKIPSGFTVYTVRNGVIDDGKFIHLDPIPGARKP
jgi:3',5'-cyclic AMP phosphodiesterase CpdA